MLYEHLKTLLQKEPDYIKDGRLFKNIIIEDALKMNPKLLSILLKDEETKKLFFQEIEGMLVFDKVNFQHFISNKMFLPDSFTRFKNKIGLTEKDEYITQSQKVVLSFPYKDCVLEGGQTKEDQKRNETFYNETLAPDDIDRLLSPKVLGNFKKFSKNGEEKIKDFKNQNLIIKGNNLIALHTLKKQFANKIKLIYIDPPYNTGNDGFQYNDKFNHSTWLVFIKNRLEAAKELLKTDGVIFVQCDDNEQAYLKVLMDEVFGRENFVTNFLWEKSNSNLSKFFKNNFENIICFIKNKNTFKDKFIGGFSDGMGDSSLLNKVNSYRALIFPANSIKFININKGRIDKFKGEDLELLQDIEIENYYNKNQIIVKANFKWTQNKLDDELKNKKTKIISKTKSLRLRYQRNNKGDILLPYKSITRRENVSLSNLDDYGFQYAKPENLLYYLIRMTTQKNDIVLDFCLGSGTTAAVAHKMGRQYIGIEQMDYIETIAVERLKKVIAGEQGGISKRTKWQGGGSFIYCELKGHADNYIKKVLETQDENKLLSYFENLKTNTLLSWKVNISKLNKKRFSKLPIEKQKELLINCLDKNNIYIALSEMEDADYKISEEEKRMNNIFQS